MMIRLNYSVPRYTSRDDSLRNLISAEKNPVVHKRKRRLLAEERKTKPDIVSAQAAVVSATLKAKKSTSIVARTEGSMHGEHAKYGSSGAPLSHRSVRWFSPCLRRGSKPTAGKRLHDTAGRLLTFHLTEFNSNGPLSFQTHSKRSCLLERFSRWSFAWDKFLK